MRVGVTGGAGFIGQYVCDVLARRGHQPFVLDHRAERGSDGWGPNHLRRAEVYQVFLGDARDDVAVTEFAAQVDGIIHLASVLGTQETVQNPRPAVSTNIVAGMNVFEAATQYGIPVVNICVGNAGMSNPYSASKTAVESLGHMYVRDRGTKLNQVRVVNAYGPRQVPSAPFGPSKVRKIMPAFICRALTGQPIEVYGDGQQVSDCVYVGDAAVVLVKALEAAAGGGIFDLENDKPTVVEVGPAQHYTVNEIAREVAAIVQAATGSDIVPVKHLPMRPGETPGARVVADVHTLRWIGMTHKDLLPLDEGILRTVEWYRDHWLPGFSGVDAPPRPQPAHHNPTRRADDASWAQAADQRTPDRWKPIPAVAE